MGHLTIGELIEKLEEQEQNDLLYTSAGYILDGNIGSYRGYYEDASFEYKEESTRWDDPELTVGEFAGVLRGALNSTLEGYKGGEYYCGYNTSCWLANYGDSSGLKIVGVEYVDGKTFLMTVLDY